MCVCACVRAAGRRRGGGARGGSMRDGDAVALVPVSVPPSCSSPFATPTAFPPSPRPIFPLCPSILLRLDARRRCRRTLGAIGAGVRPWLPPLLPRVPCPPQPPPHFRPTLPPPLPFPRPFFLLRPSVLLLLGRRAACRKLVMSSSSCGSCSSSSISRSSIKNISLYYEYL